MDWLGTLGGIAGIVSAMVAIHQWWKVSKKIAMLSDASKAAEVLPAWYTSRMMKDDWLFGLLTSDGRTIAIKRITAISDDGRWMDVELAASVKPNPRRQAFRPAILDETGRATVPHWAGSGDLCHTSPTHGLVELPVQTEEVAAGSIVRFLPWP